MSVIDFLNFIIPEFTNLDYFIGMLIGLILHNIFEQINIVLSYKKKVEFLHDKIKSLRSILTQMNRYDLESPISQIDCDLTVVPGWLQELNEIYKSAFKLAKRCKIPTINVFFRYRMSVRITRDISIIDRHLKSAPSFELMLLLWQKTKTEVEASPIETAISTAVADETVADASPQDGSAIFTAVANETVADADEAIAILQDGSADLVVEICDFVFGIIGRAIDWAIDHILHFFKNLVVFRKKLNSFQYLCRTIEPIVREIDKTHAKLRIGKGISSGGLHHEAVNEWIEKMNNTLEKAKPVLEKASSMRSCNVVSRHKMCKSITELISEIEKHLKSVPVISSAINLELIFQKRERVAGSTISCATANRDLKIVEQQMPFGEEEYIETGDRRTNDMEEKHTLHLMKKQSRKHITFNEKEEQAHVGEGEEDLETGKRRTKNNEMEAKHTLPIMRKKSSLNRDIEQ